MSAHWTWDSATVSFVVIGGAGRRHCECGELEDDRPGSTTGDDPMVNTCTGCEFAAECAAAVVAEN